MKKLLCILLTAMMLFGSVAAIAEDWTCSSCGNTVSGNFCNNCGSAKPSTDWTCPNCNITVSGNFCNNCGSARPTGAAAAATTAPVQVKDDPEEFKAIAGIAVKPITDAKVVNYINMGDGAFTLAMSNGSTYMGIISDSDGGYAIEIMSYSSYNSTPIESPFDYQSDDFRRVLNYLIRKTGATVTAIIPMFSDIYSVQDSAGNTYMLTVMCSPAMVAIGLLDS